MHTGETDSQLNAKGLSVMLFFYLTVSVMDQSQTYNRGDYPNPPSSTHIQICIYPSLCPCLSVCLSSCME